MGSNNDDTDVSSVEFTLEDTYEHLKELKSVKEQEVKRLINIVKNNKIQTLGPDTTPELIRQKRLKYIQSMQKFVARKEPQDFPIPNTNDFYTTALKELEDEVINMEKLDKITDEEIKEIESDIAYMEKKLATFEEMKKALATEESETTDNFEAEMVTAKRIFQDVKKDLEFTVNELFPGNERFQELLCILTRALCKGGDDLYINVTPDTVDFINFLEIADIIQFHPNDKNKVKLRDL